MSVRLRYMGFCLCEIYGVPFASKLSDVEEEPTTASQRNDTLALRGCPSHKSPLAISAVTIAPFLWTLESDQSRALMLVHVPQLVCVDPVPLLSLAVKQMLADCRPQGLAAFGWWRGQIMKCAFCERGNYVQNASLCSYIPTDVAASCKYSAACVLPVPMVIS